MTGTTAVLLGLAGALEAAGLTQPFTTAKYSEDPTRLAVGLEDLPAAPPTALSLEMVGELDDRDQYNPDVYVRLRFRAAGKDVRVVHAFADRAKALLHTTEARGRVTWPGGISVLTCFRTVRGTAAANANGLWMRPDTYRITPHTGSGD